MKKHYCLNQVFRPKIYIPKEGWGNCTACTPNDRNRECLGYTSIALYLVEIKVPEREDINNNNFKVQ